MLPPVKTGPRALFGLPSLMAEPLQDARSATITAARSSSPNITFRMTLVCPHREPSPTRRRGCADPGFLPCTISYGYSML